MITQEMREQARKVLAAQGIAQAELYKLDDMTGNAISGGEFTLAAMEESSPSGEVSDQQLETFLAWIERHLQE